MAGEGLPKVSLNNQQNMKKLRKYWSHCTRNRAITIMICLKKLVKKHCVAKVLLTL